MNENRLKKLKKGVKNNEKKQKIYALKNMSEIEVNKWKKRKIKRRNEDEVEKNKKMKNEDFVRSESVITCFVQFFYYFFVFPDLFFFFFLIFIFSRCIFLYFCFSTISRFIFAFFLHFLFWIINYLKKTNLKKWNLDKNWWMIMISSFPNVFLRNHFPQFF